ncbi:phage capsid protein [Streptomyces sp. NPDC086023]|uniref:phage capsid protein n=1 Tax=Streptomyces sp. NPDC086023 TaxID=3365746 RepID=UPI0037D3BBD7
MPLPENNAPWPPPRYAAQLADMAIDDAWYSGDKAKLRKVYAMEGYGRDERDGTGRPWRFWERPRPMGRRDNRLHVPLAGDIAAKSAALLFSEPPTFTFESEQTQQRWDEIAEACGLDAVLREGAEVSSALGGIALRATWNTALAKRPLISAVHVDGALPDYEYGVMTGITLWREILREGNTVLRHLERHEPGRVLHALYEGTSTNLGRTIPLTERAELQAIADSLDPEGEGNVITTGVPGLTCRYIPNMRPNRKYRHSMLGRSDWQSDGIRDAFMSLDETYTSWMRDIRLAKARLVAPAGFLQSEGLGKGVSFDDDREIWTAINASPTSGEGLTLVQFAIRVEEHERSMRAFSRKAVESAGYSAQSFGLGDATALTATEVLAHERSSLLTKGIKGGYWVPELVALAEVVLQLDRAQGFSSVTAERPRVELADSVSEDPQTTATTLELLNRAQAASIETRVRWLNPTWDDTAVREETERILKETGALVADPLMTGSEGPGAPGFGDPAGGGEAD